MNVLITAGGTTEKIDNVRHISNISTGKLGLAIADCFSSNFCIDKIYYICSRTAIIPNCEKIEIIYVDSVEELENTIKHISENKVIDIIVHSMAVSDYKIKSVMSAEYFIETVLSNIDCNNNFDKNMLTSAIFSSLEETQFIKGNGKISSNFDNMLLVMESTCKIISLFQDLFPKSTLVGFKLLDNVSLEILIDTGFKILEKNKCSFVLANDLKDICTKNHIGYLIDKTKDYTKYYNKKDIAEAIVSSTVNERRNLL